MSEIATTVKTVVVTTYMANENKLAVIATTVKMAVIATPSKSKNFRNLKFWNNGKDKRCN